MYVVTASVEEYLDTEMPVVVNNVGARSSNNGAVGSPAAAGSSHSPHRTLSRESLYKEVTPVVWDENNSKHEACL